MSFDGLLTHTVYKNIQYSSQNNFGEWSYTYSTQTSTGINCRMSPWTVSEMQGIGRGESIIYTGKYDDVRYRCFMSVSETINIGDRLVYGSQEYRVKDIITDSSSHHKTALLTEL